MDCFSSGQAYVALSRVRDLNGLYLKRKLPYLHEQRTLWDGMVSERVVDFYDLGGSEEEEKAEGKWFIRNGNFDEARWQERNLDMEWETRRKQALVKTLSATFEGAGQLQSDDVKIRQYVALLKTAQAELGEHRLVFDISFQLGREMLERGDVKNAEILFKTTFEGRCQCLGEESQKTLESLLYLSFCHGGEAAEIGMEGEATRLLM